MVAAAGRQILAKFDLASVLQDEVVPITTLLGTLQQGPEAPSPDAPVELAGGGGGRVNSSGRAGRAAPGEAGGATERRTTGDRDDDHASDPRRR